MWYKEVPVEMRVSDDRNVDIWWDTSIETTQKMEHQNITMANRLSGSGVDVCRFLSAMG